jgi:DNA-binding beta-propeller fold protein YncE
MQTSRRIRLLILAVSFVTASLPAVAQVVTATLPAGVNPYSVAVNSVTNTMYAVNDCGNDPTCNSLGTVTVINGANNSTASVNVGAYPYVAAVNSVTNKIYVANQCGTDLTCNSVGTVTVIDGTTNNIVATVTTGYYPYALAVNATTNMIYVANDCGNDSTCSSPGTVTVINANDNYSTSTINVGLDPESIAVDPATNFIYVANASCFTYPSCPSAGTVTVYDANLHVTVATLNVGVAPFFIAVNSVTNRIYVSNDCGTDTTCSSLGTVTVINGITLGTTPVNVGFYPQDIAVNSATNQIYVANNCGNTCNDPGSVTVINGNTNDITATVNVAFHPVYLDIDTVANKIYVANTCGNDPHCKSPGTVTVIDGAHNSTLPIAVGDEPDALGVNSSTHTIYVPNFLDGTVSVIGGNTKLELVNVTPCRLVDTRSSGGPITGGTSRNFPVPQLGGCGIPTTAAAYSLNVTVVPPQGGTVGYLTIWPTSEVQPVVSTLNSPDGRVKANAAIVPAGVSGAVSVYVSNTTNVLLDIDAYFAPATSHTYQFYPLTPCRIVDTRGGQDQGMLLPGMERDYLIAGTCGVPSTATAYSFNVTVLPSPGGLDFLTVWPEGEPQPTVSTLNDNTGTIVANAAIVPAGSNNKTAFYAHSNSTNLLLDVNGYFAPAGADGLSMYPQSPCRVLDTRQNNGPPFMGQKTVNVADSACPPASTATAYIFNATVVPPGPMLFLSLWPDGEMQPVVSTLNAKDGFITSNMAIVPTTNGSIDAYAAALTQLILDISGYFAP